MKKLLVSIVAATLCASAATVHPILEIGSPAPDFSLPGVDGQIHKLSDYAASPVLAIIFTCNHCPIASIYETRIQKLADEYGPKGVAVVAIQPNDPNALRVDELDSADTNDTLDEMKIRVRYKHLRYPYLYDGETQSVARALGPQATPHVFMFDKERKLRYQGRFDDSYRMELVKSRRCPDAIDALLAGKPVPVAQTGRFRLLHQVEGKGRGAHRRPEEDRCRAGAAGVGQRRGSEKAACQRNRQADAGELLGDLVRTLRARIS